MAAQPSNRPPSDLSYFLQRFVHAPESPPPKARIVTRRNVSPRPVVASSEGHAAARAVKQAGIVSPRSARLVKATRQTDKPYVVIQNNTDALIPGRPLASSPRVLANQSSAGSGLDSQGTPAGASPSKVKLRLEVEAEPKTAPDPDEYHDILHEHRWSAELGYGYLPSASDPPTTGSDPTTAESDPVTDGSQALVLSGGRPTSFASAAQGIQRILASIVTELSSVRSDGLYIQVLLARAVALVDDSITVAPPAIASPPIPSTPPHGHGHGVVIPAVDYSRPHSERAASQREALCAMVEPAPVSRINIAITAHCLCRMLSSSPLPPPLSSSLLSSLLRGLYVNSAPLSKLLSSPPGHPDDIGTLYRHGLPAMSAWLSDHQEAKRLAHRLACVRAHSDTLAVTLAESTSRKIQSLWRLAYRLVLVQVRRRNANIRMMMQPARVRIQWLFEDLPASMQHNILLVLANVMRPLKAYTALQICRALSVKERLELFRGLSAWLRFGDDVLDTLPQDEHILDSLEALVATIRAHESSGDDDYTSIRRKLTALSTTSTSKNITDLATLPKAASTSTSTFNGPSVIPQVIVTTGGNVTIKNGAVLLHETRKICGCAGMRSALQVLFDEETANRIAFIQESRLNELDRRVTAALLRKHAEMRSEGTVTSASGGILVPLEPVLLEELPEPEKRKILTNVASQRAAFIARMDSKKAQLMSGGVPKKEEAAPVGTALILDDATLEDLLQHDGLELSTPAPDVIKTRGEVPVFLENDTVLREVMMIATENRRLREENEALKLSHAKQDARINKLKWQVSKAQKTSPVAGSNSGAALSGSSTSKQLGMKWNQTIVSALKLPAEHLDGMPVFAVHELIAKKIDALQADVRRAEVVILQAKEERHQAEMALRQKHGPDSTELMEKLRNAEVEVRILQAKVRGFEASQQPLSASQPPVTPGTPATTLSATIPIVDSSPFFKLSGAISPQCRIERALRLYLLTASATANSVPLKPSKSISVLKRMLKTCEAAEHGDPYRMPNFEQLAPDVSDDDADSIAFGNFDGSGEIGKQLSLTTGSEGVSTGPVSFDTITEGGEQKRSLVESVKSEALKPPRRATSAPRKRPLLVNIPAPAEGSQRLKLLSAPQTPTTSRSIHPDADRSNWESSVLTLPDIPGARPRSVSSPFLVRTDSSLASEETAFLADERSLVSEEHSGKVPFAPKDPKPSGREAPGRGRRRKSEPSSEAVVVVPASPRSPRAFARVQTPNRLMSFSSTGEGGAAGHKPANVKRMSSLKRGFTRRSGSYHGGSLSQPSSQQIVHTFDFRVLREQGAVQSQQQSLSEFEACSLIATLMQHKLTLDAQADVAGQERPELIDSVRGFLLEKYSLQSIADNVLEQLRSYMLGDLDTDAVTGVSLSALTVSGMDSVIVPECRHLAVDFYLHALSFTLGIDPTTTASVEDLPKVWGLGVPGFSAPEKATLSKVKAVSTSLKLLPKACSSRWLATLRSAFTAGGDSIDIDSYLDVIMALWFELHHDRVAMVMQSMNLANRSSQALNVEGFVEVVHSLYPDVDEVSAGQMFDTLLQPGANTVSFEQTMSCCLKLARLSKSRMY